MLYIQERHLPDIRMILVTKYVEVIPFILLLQSIIFSTTNPSIYEIHNDL